MENLIVVNQSNNLVTPNVHFSEMELKVNIPFPWEKQKDLRQIDPKNETNFIVSENAFYGQLSWVEIGNSIDVPDLDSLICEAANENADNILSALTKSKQNPDARAPFNGVSKGISGISPLSFDGASGIGLATHQSNFFTNRTLNKVTQKLLADGRLNPENIINAYNYQKESYWNPFGFLFSSFGVNISLVSEAKDGQAHYMFGVRPNSQLHVAVNEGMNETKDKTLHNMAMRGITEELGFEKSEFENSMTQAGLTREFFMTAQGQMGVHVLYKTKLSPKDIIDRQKTADDAWENAKMLPIPFKKDALESAVNDHEMVPYTSTLISHLARTL